MYPLLPQKTFDRFAIKVCPEKGQCFRLDGRSDNTMMAFLVIALLESAIDHFR